MDKVSEQIEAVEVAGEFRVCPACDYQRGFHVSFISGGKKGALGLVLICPSCGARYEIGKSI